MYVFEHSMIRSFDQLFIYIVEKYIIDHRGWLNCPPTDIYFLSVDGRVYLLLTGKMPRKHNID